MSLSCTYSTLQLGGSCCLQTVSTRLGQQVLRIHAADEPLEHVILCQEGCIATSWVEVNNSRVR